MLPHQWYYCSIAPAEPEDNSEESGEPDEDVNVTENDDAEAVPSEMSETEIVTEENDSAKTDEGDAPTPAPVEEKVVKQKKESKKGLDPKSQLGLFE